TRQRVLPHLGAVVHHLSATGDGRDGFENEVDTRDCARRTVRAVRRRMRVCIWKIRDGDKKTGYVPGACLK
ncbi:MAG: hypothetical protein AAFQ35_07995, partial [Pseudomonadota bacterium]